MYNVVLKKPKAIVKDYIMKPVTSIYIHWLFERSLEEEEFIYEKFIEEYIITWFPSMLPKTLPNWKFGQD